MTDLHELARLYFDVTLPVSSVVLKKAYRRECMRLHPDVNGGDEYLFKEMYKAYETLVENVTEVFEEEEYKEILTTVCDAPLAKLGLGLGPTVNGSDCPECGHKGYIEQKEIPKIRCERCNGIGYEPLMQVCGACHGSGKFKQRRSKRIVDCRVCKGTGHYMNTRDFPLPCRDCHGRGTVYDQTHQGKKWYIKCYRCEGTGEIPMWNPVLPKGVLNSH